jgi:hypothetical protein
MYDVDCSEREFAGPGEARCRVTRRVLELSMWLYASLPAESREHLSRAARELGRPEMAEPGAGTTRRARSGSVDVPERKGVNSEEGR